MNARRLKIWSSRRMLEAISIRVSRVLVSKVCFMVMFVEAFGAIVVTLTVGVGVVLRQQ
jgi:hypothetical protein